MKSNDDIQARVGLKFHAEILRIQDARLRNGKSKYRVPMSKITNMITRHVDNKEWKTIVNSIINASEDEINEYGK